MTDIPNTAAQQVTQPPLVVAAPPGPPLYCVFIDKDNGGVHLAPASMCHAYWVKGSTHIECNHRHYDTFNGVTFDHLPAALEKYRGLVEGAASQANHNPGGFQ